MKDIDKRRRGSRCSEAHYLRRVSIPPEFGPRLTRGPISLSRNCDL